jgi:short subunit dehydrogenase-like uncharacterized protein
MSERRYDVVLYGASGFVGAQTVHYLAARAPRGLRWAIAGRNRARLETVRQNAGPGAAAADVLVAESHDRDALAGIARGARVLLSTAGPFALYGDAVVDACVEQRTHYLDITGETPWVRGLIDRHHARAAQDGTRLVPCCGFDSVPSDLGVWLAVRALREAGGGPCREARGYFRLRGGFNGGTLASAVHQYASGQAKRARDPFILVPGEHRKEDVRRNRDPDSGHYDKEIGAWVGPFFMGPVNTRVVRRSAALLAAAGEPYGPEFSYQEYLKYGASAGRLKVMAFGGGLAAFQSALANPALRRLLTPLLPKPGTGPSEQAMDNGWFRCEVLALGQDGLQARALMHDRGDPGNRATVKFVCESALALAVDGERLPDAGGVLTPATAFGGVLSERLRAAGMTIETSAG